MLGTAPATHGCLRGSSFLPFSLEFSYTFTRCIWVFLLWSKENINSQKKAFYFSRNLELQRSSGGLWLQPRVPRRGSLLHRLPLDRMKPLVARTALQSCRFVPPTAVLCAAPIRESARTKRSFVTHGVIYQSWRPPVQCYPGHATPSLSFRNVLGSKRNKVSGFVCDIPAPVP